MPTLAGIEFEEWGTSESNLGPVRRLRCKREDAHALINDLLGRVARPGSNVTEFARLPEHPNFPGFFVREVRREVSATRNGIDTHAVLTATYSKPDFIPGF